MIVKNGGTLTTTGATVGTVSTTLTSDVAANAASFAVAAATGWVSGDKVVIASTTRTAADTEQITIGAPSGLSIPVTVGGGTGGNTVKNAHGGGGTALVIAEVGHLSRNVRIRSSQTTLASTGSAYIDIKPGAVVNMQYTEFSYLGANVAGQRGIEIETTTGSCSITNCSLHDCRNWGLYFLTAAGSATFSTNVVYNLNTAAAAATSSVLFAANSGSHPLNANLLLALNSSSNGAAISCAATLLTFTNNIVAGAATGAAGFAFQLTGATSNGITFSGNTFHSNAGHGFGFNSVTGVIITLSSCIFYRNGGAGVNLANQADKVVLDTCTLFGNATQNILVSSEMPLWLKGCTVRSDATFATASGLLHSGNTSTTYITDSTFGAGTAHTQDISISNNVAGQVIAWNSTFNSASGVPTITNGSVLNAVRSHKDGGVATAFKAYFRYGTAARSAAQTHGLQTFSWLCTSNANSTSARPFVFPGPTIFDTLKIPISASPSVGVSITVYVYVVAIGGGGSAIKLTLLGGPVAGVGSWGTDLTASTSTTGSWQALTISGLLPTEDGVLEAYITADTNGTSFHVGDVAIVGTQPSTTTMDVVSRALPLDAVYAASAAAAASAYSHALPRGR